MKHRWTSKDLILLLVNVIVIVLLFLTMYMIDRQWIKMADIQRSMKEQTLELQSLRSAMSESQVLSNAVPNKSHLVENSVSLASNDEAESFANKSIQDPPGFAQGDWMVMSLATSLKTISPVVSTDKYARTIQNFVIETLLVRDPDSLEWEGLLAESWTSSEDGLRFDITLKPNLHFSDGSNLDAQDVKFSFDFIMNDKIASPALRSYLNKISSVEVIDNRKVRFLLKEPYFASLSLLGEIPVLSRKFYGKFLTEPESYNQSKGNLFGSGPFVLESRGAWSPESGRVELSRNEKYWGEQKPPIEKLIWKTIENESARLTAFRNKELDVYNAESREFSALKNEEYFKQNTRNFDFMPPFQGYSYIGWNSTKDGKPSVFADSRVRMAMSLLTDTDRIIRQIKSGFAERIVSPFNQNSKQHDPELLPIEYNPERARQLLTEAGFHDGDGNGVLEGPDGKEFEFELVFFQGREETRRIVLLLKDLYAQAGILLKPKGADWPVMIDMLRNRSFDAITLGWTSGVETDIYQMFHSSQIADNGDNFVGFSNETLDELIDTARATTDETERMRVWRLAERVLFDEQPYTFLYRSREIRFYDKRFENIKVTKMGLNTELLPFEIFVPRDLQRYVQ